MLMDICLFINSFSVKLYLVSCKKTRKPPYNWIQVTTSDYEWLQLATSQTTGGYEPDYKWLQPTTRDYEWLQVTTNGCKQLPVKLRMTTTGIGNNLRHKNVYRFLWLHNNERSKYVEMDSKNSCVTLLVKTIEKYLRCRSGRAQMFFKVIVHKKPFNPAIY